MPPPGLSPALFFDSVNAFQRTEALRAAVDLELCTHIAGGRRTAAEIAAACGASPRGVRILADYLTIAGWLRKEGDTYHLTPEAAAFLDRKSPGYLGDALDFLLLPDLRECFRRLPEAVRRGGTAMSAEGTVSPDNPVWVAFARGMAPIMRLPAELLADLVGGEANRPLRVLDVAAGQEHGDIVSAPKKKDRGLDPPPVGGPGPGGRSTAGPRVRQVAHRPEAGASAVSKAYASPGKTPSSDCGRPGAHRGPARRGRRRAKVVPHYHVVTASRASSGGELPPRLTCPACTSASRSRPNCSQTAG
jgi:hypothetical protein